MWLTISDEERRELLDALKLMRTLREKHQDSTLSLIMAASTQIALNERIESSLRLQDGAVLYLDDQTKRMPKGSVSQDGLNVLKPCLLRMARELPDKTVTEFSSDEIEEYLDDQDWSPRTFNNNRYCLYAFFKWAVEEKYVKENPIAKIEKYSKKLISKELIVPSVSSVAKILTAAEQEKFHHLQAALDLGFGLALRASEISKMVCEDITEQVVHVPSEAARMLAMVSFGTGWDGR